MCVCVCSKTTTKEVITGLLKKFHILDHPRKFAMYEQEFNEKNKLGTSCVCACVRTCVCARGVEVIDWVFVY